MANKITLEAFEKLAYAQREAFNSLRTNLSFCGDDTKVVLFTSCTPNEGKSTITIQLSRSLAEAGKKVILIDTDLRKSVLAGRHRIKGESEIFGLSHFLSGQKILDEVICETNIDKFDIIIAGPVVPNPTELLGKGRFERMIAELREKYDYVLVDCPPLGWVIDAAVVAPKCDGAIIVVESDAISRKFVQDVKKQLEVTGISILGVVLNKVKIEGGGYYAGHKGYYNKYGGKYGKYGKYAKYGKYEGYGEQVEGSAEK